MRALAVLVIAAAALLVLPVAPASPGAGGAEHHVFNPAARIDTSQVDVRERAPFPGWWWWS